jgi:hypothetical protein
MMPVGEMALGLLLASFARAAAVIRLLAGLVAALH